MPIDVTRLSDRELANLIANHRRQGATATPLFSQALAEQDRRRSQGLEFRKSMPIIRQAAREGRFVSYKELADASGIDWGKAHYAIGEHLWSLVEYAHHNGWPMLSAIVVNKPNITTGVMEPDTLKGFIAAAKLLGHTIIDEKTFLREQQQKVFAWAQANATV